MSVKGDGAVSAQDLNAPVPESAGLMTPLRTLLFAIAAGAAVGTLYLAQPLIETITAAFGVASASGAILVTITQIGYAVGIFLIVPLGDVVNRRRLIPVILILSAAALLGAAIAPSYGLLLAALGAVGLTAVAAQILNPLAAELAAPERRGRTVGTVASGVLIGILLSRTVSGTVADLWGWRSIYVIFAVLALVLALVLAVMIPKLARRAPVPYFRLLGSVFTAVVRHPAAPVTMLITGVNFAVFTMFWTALTYLLTAQPFGYSTSQIGLMGLVGVAGAIVSRRAGVMHDRGWSVPATGIALGLLLLSLAGAWLFQTSIIGLIVVVIVLDVAVQGTLVLGQTRMVALSPSERSRLNTAMVVFNFVGGALGSFLAGPLWGAGGWNAIMIGSFVLTVLALLVWVVARRRLADLRWIACDSTANSRCPGGQIAHRIIGLEVAVEHIPVGSGVAGGMSC
ncbi:MFS transporter [Humibacter soli]